MNAGALGKKVKIDRYGRKIKKESDDLSKFYEHEEDSKEEQSSDDSSEGEESDNDLQALTEKLQQEEQFLDRARGEGLVSSSEDEESSLSSDSDSDEENEGVVEDEEESDIEIEETKPEDTEPTCAFAVVNMDWDNIRAVDLMATFVSFVPKGGAIKSVTYILPNLVKSECRRKRSKVHQGNYSKVRKRKRTLILKT